LLTEVADLDALIAPVGGGGLLSGSCLAAVEATHAVRLLGGEPAGADDAARSMAEGRLIPQLAPDTIADGLLTSLSERTFAILREHVEAIVTVTDDEIVDAMRAVWRFTKQVVEPSAAVAVAAARHAALGRARRVGVILSGGNVEPPFGAPRA
jgi:threonine dehydratase